ncbi:MAG: hypothetical protein JWL93_551 [Hyphomicrobiales bacterium]|jgi:putative tricarboxylic transport membrane protein|nr:hypothetical protein [Hyphomicrobiales bacterium]
MNGAFWRGNIDFYCGLLLLSISALAIWTVSELDFGTAQEMGPAYFPLVVAGLLGAMSLFMIVKGLLTRGEAVGHIEVRPLFFILASFLAFGLLVQPAGLIIAIVTQVALAHFASPDTRVIESILFALGLAVFSAVVFVHLLGIPVSLFP